MRTEFDRRLAEWLLARLAERNTYAGFALLAVALGQHVPPAVLDAFSWWGMFTAGALIAASEGPKS